jgi:hypothetical protein
MTAVRLFAYRLPANLFVPFGRPVPHAFVATVAMEPLGPPAPVGDLIDLHGQDGIQLRLPPSIRPFWTSVTQSTLGFSGIRLLNAAVQRW